ncbi:MAG: nitrous oxide reductase family maturation protein NosD [Gemmatimonadaceae bacterium]|nr:nitrous oxide reductase family maturation protein NosD [Gemmatimonadaceae bacterium]
MCTDRGLRSRAVGILTATALSCALASEAHARRIEVVAAPGTPIASALTLAQRFDTLLVRRGLYREPTIMVRQQVTIIGDSGAVLDGEGKRALIIVFANGVTVQGLTFRNTGFSGIDDRAALRFVDAQDCRVIGNRVENAFFGIYLARVTRCEVRDNIVSGTSGGEMDAGNGIHLWYARDVHLTRNLVQRHRDGIYFEFTHGGVVRDNVSRENGRYGLHFMFSDSCQYIHNQFVRNSAGIAVMYTNHIVIRDNLFADARGSAAYGLLLKAISDSRIERNIFRANSVALHLEDANRNQIIGNRLERNGWAVRLMTNADDNTIARNDFVANAFDVVASGERNSTKLRGNHFDGYRGYDLNRDGIGDLPHHPVRLFALIVENNPPALILLRSFLLDLLDLAERVLPVLIPATVIDTAPATRPNT